MKHWRELCETNNKDISSTIWIIFWLFILTWGEPDLIGSIVALIERIQI